MCWINRIFESGSCLKITFLLPSNSRIRILRFEVYAFRLYTCSAENKGRSTVNYRQFLAFGSPYLLCNWSWWPVAFPSNLVLLLFSEAAVRRCSSKLVLLKILQYSQENIRVGVSFQYSSRPYGQQLYFILVPKETSTQVIPEKIVEFFKTAFLWNTSGGCFWQCRFLSTT